jgi:hypothetical protein
VRYAPPAGRVALRNPGQLRATRPRGFIQQQKAGANPGLPTFRCSADSPVISPAFCPSAFFPAATGPIGFAG